MIDDHGYARSMLGVPPRELVEALPEALAYQLSATLGELRGLNRELGRERLERRETQEQLQRALERLAMAEQELGAAYKKLQSAPKKKRGK